MVKTMLEVTDDAQDFIELRRVFEKHALAHRLVIGLPRGQLICERDDTQSARTQRGIIHPAIAEESDAMSRYAHKKVIVCKSFIGDSLKVIVCKSFIGDSLID